MRLTRLPGVVAAAIVGAAIVVAGGRLMSLSLQRHAEDAHSAARQIGEHYARAIESQLTGLSELAQDQAAAAAATAAAGPAQRDAVLGGLPSVPTARDTFWLLPDGSPLSTAQSDQATVRSLSEEFVAGGRVANHATEAEVFGPMREGSRWIIGARAPVAPSGSDRTATALPWAVAYKDLAVVLSAAQVSQITAARFAFELLQQPHGGVARTVISSIRRSFDEPEATLIHAPAATHLGDGELLLGIRPLSGWYPPAEIVADLTLLALVVWLASLFTYDTARHALQLHAALGTSERRLQSAHARLSHEVEQREKLVRSYEFSRHHDTFTGLPNRRYLMNQLDRALRTARVRRHFGIAVMLIDVDRFRLINESLGQTAGDDLMLQIARRFEKTASAVERVIARWDRNQIAVLLSDLHSVETAIASAKLLQQALAYPFELRRFRLSVAVNIGIAWVESGLQRAEEAMREAEIALSAAARRGGTAPIIFDDTLRDAAETLVHLEADLQIALERDEFRLQFQPVVDLYSGRAVGAEALLRWCHPVEGILAPERFLPIAEEAGLIEPITRWVIRSACQQAGQWRRRFGAGADFFIDVNLAPSTMRDAGLADYIASSLASAGLAASALRFDIAERSLVQDPGAARDLLDRLHHMGAHLTLDDFGTGYTSLGYVKFFPFDHLKIDRSFVSQIKPDSANGRMLQAMVQMAASLGVNSIAEGVETQSMLQFLRQIGCRLGQGFLFCAPVDADTATEHIGAAYCDSFVPTADSTAVLDIRSAPLAEITG